MEIHIHIHHHQDGKLDEVLTKVNQLLVNQIKNQKKVMKELHDLEASTAKNETVIGSAVGLLNSLSELIKAAGTDKVKLKAITDHLDGNSDALAAAVVANTPAAE